MKNKSASKTIAVVKNRLEWLRENVEAFGWENPESYATWLAQTYHMVNHTPVFLATMAAAYGVEDKEGHDHSLKHLRQEMRHEALALGDLESMGRSLSEIPELLETRLLYQTQYYFLQRSGPISHMGYSLMLEGLAVQIGKSLFARARKAHGPDAVSFLQVHSTADLQHFEEGEERLASASPRELYSLEQNLDQCIPLYARMLESIEALVLKGLRKKAA